LNKDGGPRRTGLTRIPNRQFKDYNLYMTVEKEEVMLANMEESALDEEEDEEVSAAVTHYIMVHHEEKESLKKKKKKYKPKTGQYLLEAGIRHFGKEGETAVTKELNQFNAYGVFKPQHSQDLLDNDKKKALLSLIFLWQKKNGAVKARSCANDNPQRKHILKEEAAAPTVALELVFLTSTIDTKENREVVIIDIPSAFLHADN
jgi:hypothetical protein